MSSPRTIHHLLDQLYAGRSPIHLANDPLSFCHRYSDPVDREIAAVIASSFAYGGIKTILGTLGRIFARLGPSPSRFVREFDPANGREMFSSFKHRFNDGRDLCALLWALRRMLETAGSVESFMLSGHRPDAEDITETLDSYVDAVLDIDYTPVFGQPDPPAGAYFRFLFPAPRSGSACKRLCMFLRWMVRPADGIDLGLWHGIAPSQLVIPVDTHIQRISGYLGFTRRRTADWRMAREITGHLRRFDPHDPVKYDFSLAHLGISEGCSGTARAACLTCPIARICTHSGT